MENGMFNVSGAELYYEKRGHGPALLMISGAGGDAGYYSDVADELADAFTVINYDRRGNSRSTGRSETQMKMSDQVDDAKALIDGLAGGEAIVFGNSGGAIIALELAARYPEAIRALIAHEPPAVRVLPESDPWYDFFDRIGARYRQSGFAAAMQEFAQTVQGDSTDLWPQELAARVGSNFEYLFQYEWDAFGRFVPDYEALKRATFPIVLAAGSADRGLYYARPSIEIATRIGAAWSEFPGVHLEFITRPSIFSAALRPVATHLYSKVEGVSSVWAAPTPTGHFGAF